MFDDYRPSEFTTWTQQVVHHLQRPADEAHAIGLVTSLAEPGDLGAAVDLTVQGVTAYSPFGQRMTKQVYRSTIDAPSLEAALEVENRTQILANGSEDAAEARRAFLEKRRPVWTGR